MTMIDDIFVCKFQGKFNFCGSDYWHSFGWFSNFSHQRNDNDDDYDDDDEGDDEDDDDDDDDEITVDKEGIDNEADDADDFQQDQYDQEHNS